MERCCNQDLIDFQNVPAMWFRRLSELIHMKWKIVLLFLVGVIVIIVVQFMLFSGNNKSAAVRRNQHPTSLAPPKGREEPLVPGISDHSLVVATTGLVEPRVGREEPVAQDIGGPLARITPRLTPASFSALPTGTIFDQLMFGRRQTPPMPKIQNVIHFDDEKHHVRDQSEVADDPAKKIRLLCWVMTSPENHKSRAIHVKATWGKRCDKLLFASERDDGTLPFIIVNVDHGRDHLTAKTMVAFDYVYKHHIEEFDWFLKADDDTYVIVENMKYFLSSQDPTRPMFFGHHFKPYVAQGYFSGGAGYILSREALRRFGSRPAGVCRDDQGAEDVEMGKCMNSLGVMAGDSRDALGRSRFHCFDPETHIHGGYPDWYYSYDKYGGKKGIESISDYAITFHYVSVEKMYDLEFYIYHLRPYGIFNSLQHLNVPAKENRISTFEIKSPSTVSPRTETNPISTFSVKLTLIKGDSLETPDHPKSSHIDGQQDSNQTLHSAASFSKINETKQSSESANNETNRGPSSSDLNPSYAKETSKSKPLSEDMKLTPSLNLTRLKLNTGSNEISKNMNSIAQAP